MAVNYPVDLAAITHRMKITCVCLSVASYYTRITFTASTWPTAGFPVEGSLLVQWDNVCGLFSFCVYTHICIAQ